MSHLSDAKCKFATLSTGKNTAQNIMTPTYRVLKTELKGLIFSRNILEEIKRTLFMNVKYKAKLFGLLIWPLFNICLRFERHIFSDRIIVWEIILKTFGLTKSFAIKICTLAFAFNINKHSKPSKLNRVESLVLAVVYATGARPQKIFFNSSMKTNPRDETQSCYIYWRVWGLPHIDFFLFLFLAGCWECLRCFKSELRIKRKRTNQEEDNRRRGRKLLNFTSFALVKITRRKSQLKLLRSNFENPSVTCNKLIQLASYQQSQKEKVNYILLLFKKTRTE